MPIEELPSEKDLNALAPEKGSVERAQSPDILIPDFERIGRALPIPEEVIEDLNFQTLKYLQKKATQKGRCLAGTFVKNLVYGLMTERPTEDEEILSDGELALATTKSLPDYSLHIRERNKASKTKLRLRTFSSNAEGDDKGFDIDIDEQQAAGGFPFSFEGKKNIVNILPADIIRAYITLDRKDTPLIQRHFVDLCQYLSEAKVSFNAKAASPSSANMRTENMVLYIPVKEQPKASELIKEFLRTKHLGQGNVLGAIWSPDQPGLSWAAEPDFVDVQSFKNMTGLETPPSYNAMAAALALPIYLRRLSAAMEQRGDPKAAALLRAEAARVQDFANDSIKFHRNIKERPHLVF